MFGRRLGGRALGYRSLGSKHFALINQDGGESSEFPALDAGEAFLAWDEAGGSTAVLAWDNAAGAPTQIYWDT